MIRVDVHNFTAINYFFVVCMSRKFLCSIFSCLSFPPFFIIYSFGVCLLLFFYSFLFVGRRNIRCSNIKQFQKKRGKPTDSIIACHDGWKCWFQRVCLLCYLWPLHTISSFHHQTLSHAESNGKNLMI